MDDRIARFTQALEKNPANQLARFSLAKTLFDAERFDEAREHFTVAVARQADWMAAHILLGKCEESLGQFPAARTAFVRALELARAQNHDGPRAELEEWLARLR